MILTRRNFKTMDGWNLKTPVNLETTAFDPTFIAHVVNSDWIVPVWDPKAGFWKNLQDFGTVLIGENITEDDVRSFCGNKDGNIGPGPLFTVPDSWKLADVAKAFGIFPSKSQAMKNGWDGDIPEGFSQRQVRIHNVKGVITFLKIIVS